MRRALSTFLTGVAAALAVFLAGTGQAAAQACLVELTGTTGTVRFDGLAPGDRRAWWTSVRNVVEEPVDVELRLRGNGALAGALEVAVDRCDTPWSGAPGGTVSCAGTHTRLLTADVDPSDGTTVLDLGVLSGDEVVHLRSTATMRTIADDRFQGAAGEVVGTYAAEGASSACTVPPEEPPDPVRPDDPAAPDPPGSPDPTAGEAPNAPPGDRGGAPDPDPAGPPAPGDRPSAPGPNRRLPVTGAAVGALALGAAGSVGAGLVLTRVRERRGGGS
jgi:hypothetical protein